MCCCSTGARKDEYEPQGADVSDLDTYFLKRGLQGSNSPPVAIAAFLQRSDTAVIYPEAPEEVTHLRSPEAAGQNRHEHGTRMKRV